MTVSAVDVLTDQRGVRAGLYLKAFAKHLSAFSNLRKKRCQFHFALAGQIRGPLADCIEFVAKQFRCSVCKARIIRFTNSGKRKIKGHCDDLKPKPEAE